MVYKYEILETDQNVFFSKNAIKKKYYEKNYLPKVNCKNFCYSIYKNPL